MSLFQRREKAAQFTIVGNQAARDPNLSLKAKGLLLLMLSFSEGWTYRMSHIETLSSDKEHATKSALHELMAAGYVLREKKRAEDGTFQWIYTVDDEPFAAQSETTPQFSTDGSSTDGKSRTKKNNPRKPSKKNKENTSTADAAGGEASSVNQPEAEQVASVPPAAEVAIPPLTESFQNDDSPATAEPGHATSSENVPPGAGGAARPISEHQAVMSAIRNALYPGTERCADKLEARLAAASKQLRSAGLDAGAPAGILAHIRDRHPWRKYVTPETLVEHSAEWASARAGHELATAPARTAPAALTRSVGRPQTTEEAAQRSVDTASNVLAHIRNRRASQ